MISLRTLERVTGAPLSRATLAARIWPPIPALEKPPLSVRQLSDRLYAGAVALDSFEKSGKPSKWKAVSKPQLVSDLRDRLIDPALIHQRDTMLCGPMTLIFELARRAPSDYVGMARSLFETGSFTCSNGRVIKVDQDLLEGALSGPGEDKATLSQADWMMGTALRDDENWFWDVDADKSKSGIAGGLTTVAEMAAWTRDILNLKPRVDRPELGFLGEAGMIKRAAEVVAKGGVALLCIDGALIKPGNGDDEEDFAFIRTNHTPLGKDPSSGWIQSRDDFAVATHWISLLDGLTVKGNRVQARIWSWSAEFELKGSLDSFGEYLHAVVLGE